MLEISEPIQQHPNYTTVWTFERTYDNYTWRLWFHNNWNLFIYISIVYLFVIFSLKMYMNDKKRLELKTPLLVWNIGLAIFSLLGALRTAPELYYILTKVESGFYSSVCKRDHHNIGTAFWGLLFTLSKAFELGDTIFIVLRKQPLIFLHWYHHITVMGYTWFTYESYDSTSRWFMVMNYIVHSLMYTYYGLKSLRVRVHRSIAMTITYLQLSQMVLGVVVNVFSLYQKNNSVECYVNTRHIHLALAMYFSYFILFINFFYKAYFNNKKLSKTE